MGAAPLTQTHTHTHVAGEPRYADIDVTCMQAVDTWPGVKDAGSSFGLVGLEGVMRDKFEQKQVSGHGTGRQTQIRVSQFVQPAGTNNFCSARGNKRCPLSGQ